MAEAKQEIKKPKIAIKVKCKILLENVIKGHKKGETIQIEEKLAKGLADAKAVEIIGKDVVEGVEAGVPPAETGDPKNEELVEVKLIKDLGKDVVEGVEAKKGDVISVSLEIAKMLIKKGFAKKK